jgi:hypothetical protein
VVDHAYSPQPATQNVQETARDVTGTSSGHALPYDTEVGLAAKYSLKGDDNDTLRLMHHFAISTSSSISNSAAETRLMRDIVPALAFEHDFLLSGILAVTALHLAILQPSAIHSNTASKHHSQALELIRPHLLHVTPDNVSALFSFSIMIACYSFGLHKTPCLDPLGEILDVFTLIRGIGDIVRAGADWLEQGPFAEQTILPTPSNPRASLAPRLEAVISSLSKHNSELVMDPAARTAYTTVIGMLRDAFLLFADKPREMVSVLPFPILVPAEFMERLKERDSLALVILAYYCVILHWLRHHIWLRAWGKEVVDAVNGTVDPEWRHCLEFAIEQVGSNV